jgi:hypothetical protein
LEDTGEDWWTAIKWVFKKWDMVIDWLDLPQGRDRWYNFCEFGNVPSGSIKSGVS